MQGRDQPRVFASFLLGTWLGRRCPMWRTDLGGLVGGVAGAGVNPGTAQSVLESRDQLAGLGRRCADGDDPELVPTEAGHHVPCPYAGRQDVGGAADVVIAGGVTVGVVDGFDLVQVDDEDAGLVAEAAVAWFLGAQVVVPAAAVQQPGQRVGLGVSAGEFQFPGGAGGDRVRIQHRRQQPRHQLQHLLMLAQGVGLGVGVTAADRAEQLPVCPHDGGTEVGADADRGDRRRGGVVRDVLHPGSDLRGRTNTMNRHIESAKGNREPATMS